mmetsp:Transcript_16249/g.43783  ORF Transcript_16249/g.43783 Transcript_16249/m.43783 type:complete len:285 (+) Transcript_16249:28-882(+)
MMMPRASFALVALVAAGLPACEATVQVQRSRPVARRRFVQSLVAAGAVAGSVGRGVTADEGVVVTGPDREASSGSTAPPLRIDPSTSPITATEACFLDISIDGAPAGRIVIELYGGVAPESVRNFRELAEGSRGFGYAGTSVYRCIPGLTIQAGDVTKDDGTGGRSIYGDSFPAENFAISHSVPGLVSMVAGRGGAVDSRFLVETRPDGSQYLDGKYVAVGRVIRGMDVVTRIENLPTTGTKNRPRARVAIDASGVIPLGEARGTSKGEKAADQSSTPQPLRLR